MERETAGRLVGLITIDPLASWSAADRAGEDFPSDASLGHSLAHLATGGHDASSGMRCHLAPGIRTGALGGLRFSAIRFPSRLEVRRKASATVSANIDHLAAELRHALVQVRHKIAEASGTAA